MCRSIECPHLFTEAIQLVGVAPDLAVAAKTCELRRVNVGVRLASVREEAARPYRSQLGTSIADGLYSHLLKSCTQVLTRSRPGWSGTESSTSSSLAVGIHTDSLP